MHHSITRQLCHSKCLLDLPLPWSDLYLAKNTSCKDPVRIFTTHSGTVPESPPTTCSMHPSAAPSTLGRLRKATSVCEPSYHCSSSCNCDGHRNHTGIGTSCNIWRRRDAQLREHSAVGPGSHSDRRCDTGVGGGLAPGGPVGSLAGPVVRSAAEVDLAEAAEVAVVVGDDARICSTED